MPVEAVQGELERRIVTVLFCDLAGFTSLSNSSMRRMLQSFRGPTSTRFDTP